MLIEFGKLLCQTHEKIKLCKDKFFISLVKTLPEKTTPNQITLSRLILNLCWLPFAIYSPRLLLIILFITGYFLDLLDGAIARLKNKITYLGQYLDVFSDRINHISLFILVNNLIPKSLITIKIFIGWDAFVALVVIIEYFLKKEQLTYIRTALQFSVRIILWITLIYEIIKIY